MKHVSILIPKGDFCLVNIEGTIRVFSWVNSYFEKQGKGPFFDIELVGASKDPVKNKCLVSITPEKRTDEVVQTDLIVIPAVFGETHRSVQENSDFTPWIVNQYKAGAEIASFCIGSFLLASTGLLDGKVCSTHWYYSNEFQGKYPKINLADEKIITESNGIYTSGGAYAFNNLLLHLIEKYIGREMAILTAKIYMIDINRFSQSPFIIFKGQMDHGDDVVKKAQVYIEEHYAEKLTVGELSEKFGISRRSFERRFKNATCNTVINYIQRVKIEAAKKALEKGRKTVNEVMYDVGYTDTKAFREVFKKFSGMSPSDYRNKYNMENLVV